MNFVTKTMVVVVNDMCTALTGGIKADQCNIRPGQSLGFIERIHVNEVFGQAIYPDMFHQAGAYMYYIIKNHVFHDGNKRTGLATAVTFLEWNGFEFAPFDEDHVFDFVVSVAACEEPPEVIIPQIANWFKTMGLDADPTQTTVKPELLGSQGSVDDQA